MNKLLCLFEILFALSITGTVYCAKIPQREKSEEQLKIEKQQNISQGSSVAATGIGSTQLVQGLSEQNVDTKTDEQMAAYIKTVRCSYTNGKSVKAGAEPIELPAGNNEMFMKLRDEYFAQAADLKERKEALGMEPGIESEIIINNAMAGLYDDENIGITDGVYGSVYRAQMGNESDQIKTNKEQEKSVERVIDGVNALVITIANKGVSNNYNTSDQITTPVASGNNDRTANTSTNEYEQTPVVNNINTDDTDDSHKSVQHSEEQKANDECAMYCADFPEDAAELGCECR